MNIKQLFLVVLCILSLNADAQDVHFSYYQFAPSTVNPALTGAYYGNIRATVLRRSQWFNVGADANDGFNTLNLLLDGNIPFGFKEGDWVSAGINLISENSGFLAEPTAGVTDFSRGFSGLSVAYHMTMGKKKASVLTFSAKYGSYSNAFNPNGEIITSNLLAGATSDIDLDNFRQSSPIQQGGNNFSENLNDLSIGFMYTTPVGKADDLRIGISSDHFLAPRFMANPPPVDPTDPNPPVIPPSALIGEQVNRRINAFVQYYTDLNSKLTFNPSILYQSMGAANNILLQSLFSYHHNEKKDIHLNFGVGVRVASNMDIPIYLGADFKDWRVGLSFDLNVSGLAASTNNAGAYELGISKIFKWDKKAKVNPKLICPRL